MVSIKKRMDAKKKKEVIRQLDTIKKKIQDGELEVEWHGFWAGLPGSWNFKIVLNEKDSQQFNTNG